MNGSELTATLRTLEERFNAVEDAEMKASLQTLLNLVETLAGENARLREENQQLKDEINRLKGEQGKPTFSGRSSQNKDFSSEQERRSRSSQQKPHSRQRPSKRETIRIDRTEICPVNRAELPDDATFKGYESVIIQELRIRTDNVDYRREVFYSPSERKTYRGALPAGIQGEFGPGIRAVIMTMKHVCNMSQPKILEFLRNFQVQVSAAYVASVLTADLAEFHADKDALYEAGLASGTYQQIDDTTARENGEKRYTHVVCNSLYTAYVTTERKDRLSVLDVLRNAAPRRFLFNREARELLERFGLSQQVRTRLEGGLPSETPMTEPEIEALLEQLAVGPRQRTRILEATAIAAYHQDTERSVVTLLLCDDAPQFKLITEELALCWVHDGRHYKKLNPLVPQHQKVLNSFLTEYWRFYDALRQFKQHPTETESLRLSGEFDRLFSTQTGYEHLDDRIAKTRAKKKELLAVLRHPEVPLHNNAAELGARVQARFRDVSFQTKSKAGTRAKDTFMSIVQTAKKLGVSAYAYIYDRVSGTYALPSLAQLIQEKSQTPVLIGQRPP
jgi:hypothetical protein